MGLAIFYLFLSSNIRIKLQLIQTSLNLMEIIHVYFTFSGLLKKSVIWRFDRLIVCI